MLFRSHKIKGKWYVFFAAGDSGNIWNIRPYVPVSYTHLKYDGYAVEYSTALDVRSDSAKEELKVTKNPESSKGVVGETEMCIRDRVYAARLKVF